jgi:hypothetical protein
MGPMIEVSVSGSPVGMYIFVQKKNHVFVEHGDEFYNFI